MSSTNELPPCPPELAYLGDDIMNGAQLGALVVGAREMYRVTKDGMQRSVARANPAMEKMAVFYRVCRKSVVGAVAVGAVTAVYRGVPLYLVEEPYGLTRVQAAAAVTGPLCAVAAAALPNIERRQRLRGGAAALVGGAVLGGAYEWAVAQSMQELESHAEASVGQDVEPQLELAASVTGTLGALLGAAVPFTPMVRAQAALVGLLGGAALGAAMEYTSPVLSAENVARAVERHRVRPGWTEALNPSNFTPQHALTAPTVDSVANAITNLSMLECGLDMLDEKELGQLEQRLRAQRAKTTDEDEAAGIQRQLAAVEQRMRQLKRDAPRRRWW